MEEVARYIGERFTVTRHIALNIVDFNGEQSIFRDET